MIGFEAYTGKLLETELLGQTPKSSSKERGLDYLPFRQAIEQVKNMQPGDPTDPTPRFSNDLHCTVAEFCGIEDYSKLSLYTAVGSSLDHFHGVDAFFELNGGFGGVIRVTIDVTKNPHKDAYKADIVLYIPEELLDLVDNKSGYNKLVVDSASRIAELLMQKKGEYLNG